MSVTRSLTQGYGSFFWGCAKFAVSPYTHTFMAIAREEKGRDPNHLTHATEAAIVCGILTFVVPILPVITSFTCMLASIAISLAVATMFLTYPVGLLVDVCNSPLESELTF